MDPLVAAGLGLAALAASILGGATGIGAAIALIPAVALTVGVREAVPVVTVAVTMHLFSRIWVNRASIDYAVARWFALGAVPGSVAGALVFANAPVELLGRGLGVFLLAVVAYRRLPLGQVRIGLRGFVAVGAGQGFLSAMFGGAGPFGAVFLLSYGLVRNAFVGTMALATLAISAAKLPVYGGYALLDRRALLIALALGAIMMVGGLIGAAIARRVSDRFFVVAIEVLIALGGVLLLVQS